MSHFINHIAIVVDQSSSMASLAKNVVQVFDKEVAHLRQRSIDLDQETRISVYLFNDHVKNVVFDQDAMRVKTLQGEYGATGMTALMDATGRAIEDMKKLPELYGDHAFLVYVLTDGEENRSKKYTSSSIKSLIEGLPENWTVIAQVPNTSAIHEAKKCGFPVGNIEAWSQDVKGLEKATSNFRSSFDSYMTNRASGVLRGTKSFFTTDLGAVSKTVVTHALNQLSPKAYETYPVAKDSPIKEFLEKRTGRDYVLGGAYYELMKTEAIQAYKQVVIQNRKDGKVYSGDQARSILGLPNYEIKVAPGDHGDWRIFVQSTSVNRKLIKGTQVLVMV